MMKKFLFIFVFGLASLACWAGNLSVTLETPTLDKVNLTEIVSLSTASASPSPSILPSPSTPKPQTPTVPTLNCVPPQAGVELSASTMADFPHAILNYLNQGGTPDELVSELQTGGFGNPFGASAVADFTGDGISDVAVSLVDPLVLDQPPVVGVLHIYVCQGSSYTLAYDQAAETGYSLGVHLWVWQDLNGDGAAELVASDGLCGASTCFENVKILGWDGLTFTNWLADRTDRTDDLPSPQVRVVDPDGDGVFDLAIDTAGFGSVGGGPPRGKTRVWKYDVGQRLWVFASNTLAPSTFRIHALHDADTAARQGDYETALALYQRVVDDDLLEDWADPATERANLSAFAMYRMATIFLIQGEHTQAEAVLTDMRNRFPPESEQAAYVDMTLLVQATLSTGLEATCAAVMVFAATYSTSVLDPLGSMSFGYGNPNYTSEEMCLGK